MAVESATYIADLNASNPTGSDAPPTLGTHIRLLKSVLKASFPNVSGAVSASGTELSYLSGVTSPVQTQLNSKLGFVAASGVGGGATLSRSNFQVYVFTSLSSSLTLPASPQVGDIVILISTAGTNTVNVNTGQTLAMGSIFGATSFSSEAGSVDICVATSTTNWNADDWI